MSRVVLLLIWRLELCLLDEALCLKILEAVLVADSFFLKDVVLKVFLSKLREVGELNLFLFLRGFLFALLTGLLLVELETLLEFLLAFKTSFLLDLVSSSSTL